MSARVGADLEAYYGGRRVRWLLLRRLINPSVRASGWIRIRTSGSLVMSYVARSRLISKYSIDVGRKAYIGPGLNLPHPFGIVIGDGVRLGRNVTLYHGVTLGANRGAYPRVGDDVVIFPGSVVVGGICVGDGAVIGANCFVSRDVEPSARMAGGTNHQ